MVTPRPAATVILLRAPFEVLMVRRNPQLAFMGGLWAFPGGKVEPEDVDPVATARRELAEEAGITLGAEVELVPFARWITPVDLPRRFDTYFYVAEADGEPTADGSEIVDARWVPIHETAALELAFPTQKTLERIGAFASVGEVITAARSTTVEPVLPEIVHRDGTRGVVLPQPS